MSKKPPLVSVQMLTYNHEKYIAQAIESVLSQKVIFPYELVIGEDCSTDKTRCIVESYAQKYPDRIKVVTSATNVGALANDIRINHECDGKYIATLEGDDFWNDDSKLQKQVDFLEHNPEYGLVHSDVNHWYEKNRVLVEKYNALYRIHIPEGDIYYELLDPDRYLIKTPTALFRKDLHDRNVDYEIVRERGWVIADLFAWLSMAKITKIKYMPEAMATYRVLLDSSSNTKNYSKKIDLHRSVYEIRSYFAERYPCDEATIKKIQTRRMQTMLFDAYKTGDQTLASNAIKLARDNKIDLVLKNWILYVGTLSKLLNRLLNRLW